MLANLPSISFVDTDAANIEASVITMYEAIAGRTLAQGDPVRLFLQAVAMIIIQQRVLINDSAKQNLLAYAKDDKLDHLGVLVGVPRLDASAAETTIRFNLSTAQPQVVTIPAGIRGTTPNGVVFQVSNPVTVPIGDLYGDAPAECLTAGEIGNGYVPGQINQLVDPLPWIQSIANITESEGGADRELDDPYRERIRLAPESFSVAGPDGAYRFWAMSASQTIVDVSVRSPAPVEVELRPLLTGGEIPGTEILDMVYATVSDKEIRPLTDRVSVLAPEAVSYDVELVYYIHKDNATQSQTIQMAVNQAVIDYELWQKSKLGRDINPSELIWRVRAASADRVEVTLPVFLKLEKYQVAIARNVTVTYGGLTDG
ncbi:baseplate assembly protein [Sporomusa acidovorans]|uniref:Baseplate J-like protein n=1 Tax=Sporomusa acidovorans (strain ATCC 49682 / DSM 3132 / Mol) TaxID=1123286 RepID=A0ABZ3J947_SPOA4|nr:baseplate J/gp47 family protein [Sporomusa acidovorans]OZC16003.1 baseplate J-like protein [Sporomusa acidovorans DSM 3132]SDD90010.1 Phage-related baseplate assembly protein [Sporomusa acidovorans]